MLMIYTELQSKLKELANPEIACHSQRFFKTGEGEYGYGDKFLGIRVPVLRSQVKFCKSFTQNEILKLLKSPWHECRLLALLILVDHFQSGSEKQKKEIYDLYLKNTVYINNWDLVDSSCYKILGPWLLNRDRSILYDLANDDDLWKKRIAIITCMYFIKQDDLDDTLEICKILLADEHDLIHKAVGWMLREVGNRNAIIERKFLKQFYKIMPRTMLRYAIEKFPKEERNRYLQGEI